MSAVKGSYTGVGSRETPIKVLELFTYIGEQLAKQDLVLRSGASKGADEAFEKGCDNAEGDKEIYIPWKGFRDTGCEIVAGNIPPARKIASHNHPGWLNISSGAKSLHARNACQVLGLNLDNKSLFVLCWTINGGKHGGTATAIRIAESRKIPVFNFGVYSQHQSLHRAEIDFKSFLDKFGIEYKIREYEED